MTVHPVASLPEVLWVQRPVFADDRGWFRELWRAAEAAAVGLPASFVQDNVSFSRRGVLRGLHYQHPHAQGKLVTPVLGRIYDVAVDLRRGSPTFGRWVGLELDAADGGMLYVPPGFAHGFLALSDPAIVLYKCTAYYRPEADRSVAWNDPDLAIAWPIDEPPRLSPKDAAAPRLRELPAEALPCLADA